MGFAASIPVKFKHLLHRPGVVRVGGIAFVIGAALGMVRVALWARQNWLTLGSGSSGMTFDYEWHFRLIQSLSSAGVLAVCVGLLGLYGTFGGVSEKARRVARWGVTLAVSSGMILSLSTLYSTLFPPDYGSFSGYSIVAYVTSASWLIFPAGFVITGIVALRNRALGDLHWLPLVIGISLTPVFGILSYWLFYPEIIGANVVYVQGIPVERAVLLNSLGMLFSETATQIGLLLLGVVLFGSRERETKILAEERRFTEQKNLVVARRLYDEAWVRGEIFVLDELASPDVVDEYHGEVGLQNFKRNVAGLRGTFADLRFVVEDQRADGDEVTTRWSFTGTDEGGVLWYPPTGKQATLCGTFTDRFEDGKLVEHRGESETQSLIAQLGHALRE